MRTRTIKLLGVAVLAVLATALVMGTTVGAKHKRGGKPAGALKANLTGAQERPGPGDPDGRGKALVKLLPRFGAVCFLLDWRDIADPNAAHIHRAPKGVPGPVVVPFFVTADDARRKGCVDGVSDELLREIRRNPSDFYVNVHNADFPAGAIRGQLKRTGRHRGRGGRGGKRR